MLNEITAPELPTTIWAMSRVNEHTFFSFSKEVSWGLEASRSYAISWAELDPDQRGRAAFQPWPELNINSEA